MRKWAGRYEDGPLLRGEGQYTDDMRAEKVTFAAFVRSPHAHAKIKSIDTAAAKAAEGVLAVYTAKDFEEFGFGTVSGSIPFPGKNGVMPVSPFRPVLAHDLVGHAGEPVVMVVAKSEAAALDAADLVVVDYDTLPAVVTLEQAMTGKTQIWAQAKGNVAHEWSTPPDPDGAKHKALDEVFKSAAHVVKVDVVNQRICAVSMEPRAATASFDSKSDQYTLTTGTQGVTGIAAQVAMTMKIPMPKVRVLTKDVGGGFGMKASTYPEYPALLAAAKKLGKPVHWTSTRAESFLTDNHARDSIWHVELALSTRGKFLGLRVKGEMNAGAYLTGVAVLIPTLHISGCMPTVYDIPHIIVESAIYFSNTVPVGAYRGAGRPEANYLMERVVDAAARELNIDQAELRRRNLIKPEKMPYQSATGFKYDSGDFPTAFEKALEAADYKGFAARKKEAKARGKLRGIGVGCYLEISGGHYEEPARITFENGKCVISMGPAPQGQGHITVFKQLVADQLGIPDDDVEVTFGDSARDVPGFGAVASRSAMLVGSAVVQTADKVLVKATGVAKTVLQAGDAEVQYKNGIFEIAKTGRRVTLFEVAEHAKEMKKQGTIEENLDTNEIAHTGPSFPNGCHVAEVELDPDTGEVDIVRYTALSDCGVMLNQTIVEGQIEGGVVQGIGQAIGEFTRYDTTSGQLLAGSFMDYMMPRADSVPSLTVLHNPTRCTTNLVGAKGIGEAGTTGATATIVNAIENAISAAKPLSLVMPLTPQVVWKALQHA
ncbi:MAG: aerobic-type carbon monoxide dehydrogenase, large subunit CoxL/CutL-like protein [Hyphomicrobiales bacterium]|nr:aerobic-type carbon monoxide dehydrogenase, large subunit CoxL/CutL-like protein [Hyphomicrobiales bacterium]